MAQKVPKKIGHGCSWITGPDLNGTEVSRVEFRVSHQLGRRIGTSLQQDRKERARRAREAIEAALADSDLQLGRGKDEAMVPGGSGRTCTALLPVDVCRAAKRYGEPFKASRGVTQGGPLSPKIFNIMVDAIVREWIRLLLYKGREEETEVTVSDSVAEPLNTLSMEKPQGDLRSLTCGLEMSAKSLPSYLESQHGIYRSRVIDRDLVLDDRESITYAARQSPSGAWDCPVPECPGSMQTPWNLQRHFRDRHPLALDLVNIPGEGVLPRCPREFTAYGETLERVEAFKYLGRLMAMDDNDMHAVRHNLKKARGVVE
ncbi:hypothetical protein THAOC_08530 [Thalassiosira oceanica]|uniref:C2H2-type domain-containing protein n=1 Tax=Thalassiosira oceanica TaxID=159749 RepID=K0TI00_THAOC|nr:hypothetical protein THAOC_08530 [Thalassiosira oceanica]|eukprot:EJK70137.1 hypothetical protein THAOC_08530 [Thalassiosira oceanica]